MVDALFDHPVIEIFANWDFTDGAWLGAPAGLVRLDGSRKPSFEALRQRIRSDGHTSTDESGRCRIDGFRGLYTLRCDGMEAEFTLSKARLEQEIRMG